MSARTVVLLSVLLSAQVAHADEPRWYEGAAGRRRASHLGAITIGGALYISSEALFKDSVAPASCRWCNPTSYDRGVRDALRWDNTGRAAATSDVIGFAVAPFTNLGLVMLASLESEGDRASRWLDDVIPVLESAVFAALVNQAVKFAVGEQRPFVRFGDPTRPAEIDDNVSFYSGHTTLVFSLATSAGMVAHRRGYALEPVIWASGYVLAGTTGYLRIAADKHYFTDVVVGALVGSAIGLAVPAVLHGDVLVATDVQVVPTGNGVAVVGAF